MNTRRALLKAGILSLPAVLLTDASGQGREDDYEDVQAPFPPTYRLYGTNPALGPEEDKAREILAAAPKKKPLLETARYFESLTPRNKDGHSYNAQWPVRWNPVIVGLYQATALPKPYVFEKGDTISWCAAFINWCLISGGYPATQNAMSGSFRLNKGLGEATNDGTPGDIIVFKHEDPKKAAVGFGHVGILVEQKTNGFWVLGGNQYAGKRYSSVNTTFFSQRPRGLVFDSIRTFSSLGRRA